MDRMDDVQTTVKNISNVKLLKLEPKDQAARFQVIADIDLEDAIYVNGEETPNQLAAAAQSTVEPKLPLPCCHTLDGCMHIIERLQYMFGNQFGGVLLLANVSKSCAYYVFMKKTAPFENYPEFATVVESGIKDCFVPNSVLLSSTKRYEHCKFADVPLPCRMIVIQPYGCFGHQFNVENFCRESLIAKFQQCNTKTYALKVSTDNHTLAIVCKSTFEIIETMALGTINQAAGFQMITDVNLEDAINDSGEALNQFNVAVQPRVAQMLPLPCCHTPGGSAHVIEILQFLFGNCFAKMVSLTFVNKPCVYLICVKQSAPNHFPNSDEARIRSGFVPSSMLFPLTMLNSYSFGMDSQRWRVIKMTPKECKGHQINAENFSKESLIAEFQQSNRKSYALKVYTNVRTLIFECKSTC